MHNYKLLINGDLLSGDKTMSVINPASEQSVALAPHASVEQLNLAVDAAYSAFPSWKASPGSERQTLVAQIADAVEAHAEDLLQRFG